MPPIRDRKGTLKTLCDKDFAEFSGEFSGAICLKMLVLLGSALKLFRIILWYCSCDFLALGFFLSLEPNCFLPHVDDQKVLFMARRTLSLLIE